MAVIKKGSAKEDSGGHNSVRGTCRAGLCQNGTKSQAGALKPARWS